MKNYKCGHCNGENVTLERYDNAMIKGENGVTVYESMTAFRFECPDCKYSATIPVPDEIANDSEFNPELELLDMWHSHSKKAHKHKQKGE